MKTLYSLIAGLRPTSVILTRRIGFPLLFLGAGLVLIQPCAGQSGTWMRTDSSANALFGRRYHTATLLPNGKVLAAAGVDGVNGDNRTAELYDPATGTWTPTGSLTQARYNHTATLLPNGKVLVAGGDDSGTSELYDPALGTWTSTGSLVNARGQHTASLLPNGKVLVAGGADCCNLLASAELYDPATGIWTLTGSLTAARYHLTATLLADGRVLAAGGQVSFDNALATAELYDPATGTWTATGSLANARYSHTATLLPNGTVLVAGGFGSGGGAEGGHAIASAELFDSLNGTWTATGSLITARGFHTATSLPNGTVLTAGGANTSNTVSAIAKAELYDSELGTWTATGSLAKGRFLHTATLLPNGQVLAAFGYFEPSAELYSSDGGGELTLVSAASRKKHGNAGTFDINLPLTGTPGVECRVGNGGTFLQAIVFSFSEAVTSVSGTTTTTCGSVNSTTISGSTVTVELGHVTCDDSDITVIVPGVNGASGSVDASATMTLRTGDVNADGVVNDTDLKEIKMNVGRGLVNGVNFRHDITVDGKVNHGDTTLEKSKL